MESSRLLLVSSPLLLLILLSFSSTSSSTTSPSSSPAQLGGGGKRVGGREEIKNVGSNEEVQSLGRFCVEEFNRKYMKGPISFVRVVAGQKQVVSGIKYYLRIEAAEGGVKKQFDAIVVVKAWLRSKELLSFAPAAGA